MSVPEHRRLTNELAADENRRWNVGPLDFLANGNRAGGLMQADVVPRVMVRRARGLQARQRAGCQRNSNAGTDDP
jgi:hypothetical protein